MKITIRKIAEMAGVSVSTVSKIINDYDDVGEETKRKVIDIMEELGYRPSFPARALASSKSNLIGVVYAGKLNAEFNHAFFVHVMNSFKKQIGLLGYDLLFFSNEKFHYSGEDYLARCRYFQVDGCVVISGNEIEPSIDELDQSSIPCVGIDLKLSGKQSGYIMSDNDQIARKVVQFLYLHGYREIGFIGDLKSEISHLREQSFKRSLQSFGMAIRDEWFVQGEDFFEEQGYEAMMRMLDARTTLPQAIFAASDLLAIGAMRALKSRGYKIPEDIAIIGCDDIDACKYTDPALTTIRQDKDKIGKFAAHMLFDLINNQSEISHVMVEPELIIRNSCATVTPTLTT